MSTAPVRGRTSGDAVSGGGAHGERTRRAGQSVCGERTAGDGCGAERHARGRKGESGAGVLAREINTRREEASQNRPAQSGVRQGQSPYPYACLRPYLLVLICAHCRPTPRPERPHHSRPYHCRPRRTPSLAAFGLHPARPRPVPTPWSDRATKGPQHATIPAHFAPDAAQNASPPPAFGRPFVPNPPLLPCASRTLPRPQRALGHRVATYHAPPSAHPAGVRLPPLSPPRHAARGSSPQMPRPDGADPPDAIPRRPLVLSIHHPMGSNGGPELVLRANILGSSVAPPASCSPGRCSARCPTVQLPAPLFSVVMSYARVGRARLCVLALARCDASAAPGELTPPPAAQRQSCEEMAAARPTYQDANSAPPPRVPAIASADES